jgi:hypothetical protein
MLSAIMQGVVLIKVVAHSGQMGSLGIDKNVSKIVYGRRRQTMSTIKAFFQERQRMQTPVAGTINMLLSLYDYRH